MIFSDFERPTDTGRATPGYITMLRNGSMGKSFSSAPLQSKSIFPSISVNIGIIGDSFSSVLSNGLLLNIIFIIRRLSFCHIYEGTLLSPTLFHYTARCVPKLYETGKTRNSSSFLISLQSKLHGC